MCLALGLVKDFQNLEQITFLSFKGLWDQGQQIDEDRKPGNHLLLYYTIRSLINDDQVKFNLRLTESRSQIMEQLQESSLECCRNIYPSLTSLRLIRDMEEVRCLTSKALTMEQLHRKWSMEGQFSVSDFSFLEPRLALRATLLKQLSSVADDKELSDAFINTLLRMCREARQLANYQVANRCLCNCPLWIWNLSSCSSVV